MKKTILLTACILGLLAVVFGAFGAHGLKKVVDIDKVATFETGVRYQMYNAFFLFVVALVPHIASNKRKVIFYLTLIGVILFSFSIYALVLNQFTSFDFNTIGFVTPIGGAFLISAWLYLAIAIIRSTEIKY